MTQGTLAVSALRFGILLLGARLGFFVEFLKDC
jgi:hypothetical protein